MKEVKITKKELNALIFWASYGYGKAYSGGYRNIYQIMKKFKKQNKLRIKIWTMGELLQK